MPYYIATVYTLRASVAAAIGNAGISRRVVRMHADNKTDFELTIRDRYISDPDNDVWFGPIGLSKDQTTEA